MGKRLDLFLAIFISIVTYFLIFVPAYMVGRFEATCDEDQKKQYGYAIGVTVMAAILWFGYTGIMAAQKYSNAL